jgi:hypothetical protein
MQIHIHVLPVDRLQLTGGGVPRFTAMFQRCVKLSSMPSRENYLLPLRSSLLLAPSAHQSNARLQDGKNPIYVLGYSNIGATVGISKRSYRRSSPPFAPVQREGVAIDTLKRDAGLRQRR